MSITSVKEIWNGRTGDFTAKDYQRSYVRTFRVLTDSRLDGPLSVLASTLLPQLGAIYVEPTGRVDYGVALKHKKCKIDQSEPLAWQVDCEYDNEPADPEKQQKQESNDPSSDKQANDPNDRFTEVSFSFQTFQKAIWHDLDYKPLANSSKEPFDPPFEIDDNRPVITIKRTEPAFDFGAAGALKDSVNSGGFMGYGDGQVKLFNIAATRKYAENKISWEVTYEFHVRPEGWHLMPLDQGFREIIDGEFVKIREKKDNSNVGKPCFLKNGRMVDSPNYLDFRVYPSANFNNLGLF